jgi:hypothetical protein
MKGDFTRDTFHPRHEFYRVLLQQGRVQLDADWNEQVAILLNRLETLTVDLFGQHGGPAIDCGFAVFRDEQGIRLSRGRYYVEGVQCENREVLQLALPSGTGREDRGPYLLYLDVFEEYIAAAQDPAIAEVALGGLDTAGRSRVRWMVDIWPLGENAPRGSGSPEQWQREWERELPEISSFERRGLLRARASQQFGYAGSQNQLYRVEIHQGGTLGDNGTVSWKWSRENGSVAFAINSVSSDTIDLQAGPRAVNAFTTGDWVEIVTDADREDAETKRPLFQVAQVDPNGAWITLTSAPGTLDIADHPIVRRWDQRTDPEGNDLTASGGTLRLLEDAWLPLESGVEVSFTASKLSPQRYRGGDYWVIPARTATASIEWPAQGDRPEAVPPHGVKHRYAPLAVLAYKDGAFAPVHDYRLRYKPLSMT